MKIKILAIITLILLISIIAACGNNSPPDVHPIKFLSISPISPLPSITIKTSEATKEKQATTFPTPTFSPTSNFVQKNKKEITPTLSVQVQINLPTPAPAPVPTVIYISTQNLTTTNILADGLKIVYSEINMQAGTTKFWMSNVMELKKRKLITKISHKPSWPSNGRLSPDGNKLFYSVVRHNISGHDAYAGYREIWVLDVKNRTRKKMPKIINGFIKWLDNQTLIYGQDKDDKIGTLKTKFYITTIDDLKGTFVFSKTNFFSGEKLLDNKTLLYLGGESDAPTEVRAIDLYSGKSRLIQKINVPQPWYRDSISPDNTTILIVKLDTDLTGKVYKLISVSLLTGEKKDILTYPYYQGESNNPIYYLSIQWLPDSQSFSIYFPPPQKNRPAKINIVNLTKRPFLQSILPNTSFFTQEPYKGNNVKTSLFPVSWSPNGNWLILSYYPKPGQEIYILELNTGKLSRIPRINESYMYIDIIGWVQ